MCCQIRGNSLCHRRVLLERVDHAQTPLPCRQKPQPGYGEQKALSNSATRKCDESGAQAGTNPRREVPLPNAFVGLAAGRQRLLRRGAWPELTRRYGRPRPRPYGLRLPRTGPPRNTTGQSTSRCPARRVITSAAKGSGQQTRRRRVTCQHLKTSPCTVQRPIRPPETQRLSLGATPRGTVYRDVPMGAPYRQPFYL